MDDQKINNYQSNVRSSSLNNHHGNAYTYQNRMDTRRTMVPKEFLLPTFQFKKEDKHKIHNEPSLKFKGYFPNRPNYTLEQNQQYRSRINKRVVKEMKCMVDNEGANYLTNLNSKEMINVSSNLNRTNGMSHLHLSFH